MAVRSLLFPRFFGLAFSAPGLERQATQYPCWRQFTMLDEAVALCQVLRSENFGVRSRKSCAGESPCIATPRSVKILEVRRLAIDQNLIQQTREIYGTEDGKSLKGKPKTLGLGKYGYKDNPEDWKRATQLAIALEGDLDHPEWSKLFDPTLAKYGLGGGKYCKTSLSL